jgi:hypothetical protein
MDEKLSSDIVQAFQAMANRIGHNKSEEFGGAFVVVPPAVDGDLGQLSTLILDAGSSPAAFWALLKAKCDIAVAELQEKERTQGSAFGRR